MIIGQVAIELAHPSKPFWLHVLPIVVYSLNSAISAFLLKADIVGRNGDVRFLPTVEIRMR
jgi:hypothetical protein